MSHMTKAAAAKVPQVAADNRPDLDELHTRIIKSNSRLEDLHSRLKDMRIRLYGDHPKNALNEKPNDGPPGIISDLNDELDEQARVITYIEEEVDEICRI